jgi:neutral ceramidase
MIKKFGIVVGQSISGLMMIFILFSCAVVKTPYSKTEYYQKSVSRLDSIKSGIICRDDSIYAGFSRISITPVIKINGKGPHNKVTIAGFGGPRSKYAKGVHDSIFIKAIALKECEQTIVLVSADILLMPPNIIDKVTQLLSKEGVRRNQLFFSATHTHSSLGGWGHGIIGKLIAGKENTEIENWLIGEINIAVLTAISDLRPAGVGSGSFNAASFTRNRLSGSLGKKNDDFNYLFLEQTGGRKAIIGSFSAHATTIGRKNMMLSADYPGYWERKMEYNTVDMAMFCGGSMGSQSPVSKGDNFESAKFMGEALADSIPVRLQNTSMHKTLTLSSLSLKIFLPEYHIRITSNINLSSWLSKMLMPVPENVYLQVLRINDFIWFFTPGDFSGESALQIKNSLALRGYDSMVTGYNGSYVGYIIPGKYFYLNHYESKLMGWFGPTMGDYTMDLIDQMGNDIMTNKRF